jgi:hypothetical protein
MLSVSDVSEIFVSVLYRCCKSRLMPVIMATYVCFKYMLEIFYLFHTYASSSDLIAMAICICLQWLQTCSQVFFLVFCKCFRHMLSVSAVSNVCYKCVHLDVAKINRVLHML